MEAMKSFCVWFLEKLPEFLMSEPICYFVGFAMVFMVIAVIHKIINLH